MKRKVLAIVCTLSMICSFPAMAGPRIAKKISVYPVTGQKISVYSAIEKQLLFSQWHKLCSLLKRMPFTQ